MKCYLPPIFIDITPPSNFFTIGDFYSSLKNSVISEEEHASVKNFSRC